VSRALAAVCSALLLGCAADVHRAVSPAWRAPKSARRLANNRDRPAAGRPPRTGTISRQPYYTDRVTFGPDDRVREVRNLLTAENFEHLQLGMTLEQIVGTVGPSYIRNVYANGYDGLDLSFYDVGMPSCCTSPWARTAAWCATKRSGTRTSTPRRAAQNNGVRAISC